MNIWWNTFEPALTDGNWNTACAGGQWTKALWKSFEDLANTTITNVSVKESGIKCPTLDQANEGGPPPDVIVLVWRWDMGDKYPMRTEAWHRQNELLNYALKHKVPVLIHDEDCQWQGGVNDPRADYAEFIAAGVPMALTMPAFYPPVGYETLHYPYAFRDMQHATWDNTRAYPRGYVGNNYGRYEQAVEWLGGTRSDVWGNWTDPHPDRQSAEQLAVDFGDGVRFHGRLDQRQLTDVLEQCVTTVHLAKPEYCSYGFLALRWAEAAFAGTLAFIPEEFRLPRSWYQVFPDDQKLFKGDWHDLNYMDRYIFQQRVNEQQLIIHDTMSHHAWAKRIYELLEEKRNG